MLRVPRNGKNLIKSIIYNNIADKMLEQFSLRAEKSEKKKKFVRSLYELTQRAPSSSFQFQIRRGDGVRTPEPTMTLDNFLGLVDNDFRIKIHTGEEAPPKFDFPATPPPKEIRIICTTLGIDPWRFAWYTCPDTKENYKTVNRLVMSVFGRDLRTYKVA